MLERSKSLISEADVLTVDVDSAGIVTVTLNRPPVNAISVATYAKILAVFEELAEREDIRVVVFRATGKVFSGGADLKEGAEVGPAIIQPRQRTGWGALERISDLPVPVIAAVNGPALGGGCAIALASDVIVASENAVFGMTDVDVGIVGGGSFLARHLPPKMVRKMVFTGERLTAQRACELGMVDQVTTNDDLWPTAHQLAARIAEKSTVAIRTIKIGLNNGELLDWRNAYWFERFLNLQYTKTADARELNAAFVSKRKAQVS